MNSQNMLDALMNNTSRLIYFKDLQGRYTFVNREWLRLCGLSEHLVIGRTDFDLFGPEWAGLFRNNDLQVIQSMQSTDFEERVIAPDGSVVVHQSIKFPVYDRQGLLCGTGGISTDITERKRLEESLRISNQTKDKFFSIIAHDLKNPLNGLIGLTELLMDDIDTAPSVQVQKEIRLIGQTTKVLHNLLDNLLTWARSQTGLLEFEPRRLPLAAMVQESVQLVHPALLAKRIVLKVGCPDNLLICGDLQMTSTILRNLLANAIKYSHPDSEIRLRARECGDYVQVEVQDSGIGIPESRLEKLFRLESKSSTPGTDGEMGSGLGLLLCKDFAERQRGRVEVESELGKGTTMRLYIPGAQGLETARLSVA
ncbi:PAS domain S-box-containing protein [Fluviicoccus keumensis]|uniref:histidine kinase n=1 Tax=Fluviicoccus keumensis TaxID=1435465 RepID=A0A4Q7ZB77_9GAMM|nr:PAS domain-containing sensor histidine kinase [Fluviicoccus keumensis]RZU47069.1 PAS domain S-box-containing protein [Fluviicoccus keumensis]